MRWTPHQVKLTRTAAAIRRRRCAGLSAASGISETVRVVIQAPFSVVSLPPFGGKNPCSAHGLRKRTVKIGWRPPRKRPRFDLALVGCGQAALGLPRREPGVLEPRRRLAR